MPQPYDYSTVQVNPDNYFESVRQGRAEQAQQEAATRQSALQKYMPGALQGDAAARAQVMANADPEQQIALQNRFDNEGVQKIEQAMKMNGAINQLLSQVRDGDQQGFEAAKARAAQIGIPMDQMGHLTVADLPRLRAESGQTARELDIQFKQAQIAAQKANAAQSYAAADASRRAGQGGGAGRPMGRPMSAGVQSKEDEDISDIQSVQSINTQIDQILTKLDPKKGDLALGPINNLISQGQNLAGLSTPGSRDYAVLEATLEKMRNDSLRLNKGVQTEGDAIRAWNEITKYMTDPAVVREQLQRISVLNAQAAQQRLQRINIRRSRNGYDAFNPAEIGYGGGVQAQAAPSPSGQLGGPEPGTVEDGYVFRGGDPRDPANWSEVQ